MVVKEKLGLAIKEYRQAAHKTQIQTAKEAGISRSHLASIETGSYIPSIKTLLKLAKVLNIDLKILNNFVDYTDN